MVERFVFAYVKQNMGSFLVVTSEKKNQYHYGELREALLAAAEEILGYLPELFYIKSSSHVD